MSTFDTIVMNAIQSLYSPNAEIINQVFVYLSFFAEEVFIILFFATIYWSINKELGEGLLFSTAFTLVVNGVLKDSVKRVRPFVSENADNFRYIKKHNFFINTEDLISSYSFPSGHAQTAGTYLLYFANYTKRKLTWIVFALLSLSVMVSRVFLGVHYPSDVLFGFILGTTVYFIFWYFFKKYREKKVMVLWAFAIFSILTSAICSSDDSIKSIGLLIGLTLGITFEQKTVNFKTDGKVTFKILRVVVGISGVVALRFGLKFILPAGMWLDGLRYIIIGVYTTYLWPLIFSKFERLNSNPSSEAVAQN